jgi:hypothetical protein
VSYTRSGAGGVRERLGDAAQEFAFARFAGFLGDGLGRIQRLDHGGKISKITGTGA